MTIDFESQEITKNEEQDITLGMIISTDFLKRVRPMYKSEYFKLHYAKTVSTWCIEYYDKYKKAPFKDIKSLFEAKKRTLPTESQVELIDTFLSRISDKFEEEDEHYNVDYNVDKAKNYFKGSSLEILEERIRGLRLLGDYTAVEAEIARFKRVEEIKSSGTDFWDDNPEIIQSVLKSLDNSNALIALPGTLGQLVRPLRRGDFLGVAGVSKAGKSFMLLEIALWASINKSNVLFFSWEMPRDEIYLRLYQRLTGQFKPDFEDEFERIVEVPYFDSNNIIKKRSVLKKAVDFNEIYKRLGAAKGFIKGTQLRIECAPSDSMSPSAMENVIDNLEYYEGFVPDVIITDYADIAAPERQGDHRHQIDSKWLGHRAIGQKKNILMVTASHTNKQTFDRDIRKSDMSEDYRKLNHVTMALAVNKSDDDELNSSVRMRPLIDRHKGTLPNKEALILQCLECGQPYLDSRIIDVIK